MRKPQPEGRLAIGFFRARILESLTGLALEKALSILRNPSRCHFWVETLRLLRIALGVEVKASISQTREILEVLLRHRGTLATALELDGTDRKALDQNIGMFVQSEVLESVLLDHRTTSPYQTVEHFYPSPKQPPSFYTLRSSDLDLIFSESQVHPVIKTLNMRWSDPIINILKSALNYRSIAYEQSSSGRIDTLQPWGVIFNFWQFLSQQFNAIVQDPRFRDWRNLRTPLLFAWTIVNVVIGESLLIPRAFRECEKILDIRIRAKARGHLYDQLDFLNKIIALFPILQQNPFQETYVVNTTVLTLSKIPVDDMRGWIECRSRGTAPALIRVLEFASFTYGEAGETLLALKSCEEKGLTQSGDSDDAAAKLVATALEDLDHPFLAETLVNNALKVLE